MKEASDLSYEALQEIEGLAEGLTPYAQREIFRALKEKYRSIGKNEDAARLSLTPSDRAFLSSFIISLSGTLGSLLLASKDPTSTAISLGIGITIASSLLHTSEKIYSLANVLGFGSGMLASAYGFQALPATGIGLAAAVVARNSLAQKAAKAVVHIAGRTPFYALLAVDKVGALMAKALETADDALDVIACR